LWEYNFYSNRCPRAKSYATKSLKLNLASNTKEFAKSQKSPKNKSWNIIFLPIYEALIHSIWTSNEKVKHNLVFWAI